MIALGEAYVTCRRPGGVTALRVSVGQRVHFVSTMHLNRLLSKLSFEPWCRYLSHGEAMVWSLTSYV